MPAKSVKQRQAMAIAEHHPNKLYKRNKGLLKMSKEQLSEFASTTEGRLKKVSKPAQEQQNKRKFREYAKKRGQSGRSNLSV